MYCTASVLDDDHRQSIDESCHVMSIVLPAALFFRENMATRGSACLFLFRAPAFHWRNTELSEIFEVNHVTFFIF